jgi:predicted CXXCH cytochrome family protein
MNNILRSAVLKHCSTSSVPATPRSLSFRKRSIFAAAFLLLIVPLLSGQTAPKKTAQRAPALRNAATSANKAGTNNKSAAANKVANSAPANSQAAPASNKAAAAAESKPAEPKMLSWSGRLAPLPTNEKPLTSHAPYDAGDCSLCHKSGDVQNPGPIKSAVNEMCLACHEDYKDVLGRKYGHVPTKDSCTNCHNPHNSKHPKLLAEETGTLCLTCHSAMKDKVEQATVKHDALTQGAQCASCHNPHGANVEHLLIQLPMQLCLQCHGKDDVVDRQGKKLTNMKKLLDQNPRHHGPIAAEDCSACHQPHGSKNFRLLTIEYPATFYSPYDAKLYALCFNCHEEKAFTTPETDELTQFRDQKRNLHYVHVNKSERGRTCRACHEVHACTQEHNIRDGVPYGSTGWLLKLNYIQTATGGSCEKTCHQTKTYDNKSKVVSSSH